jgi:hypothetical protein
LRIESSKSYVAQAVRVAIMSAMSVILVAGYVEPRE